MAVTIKHAKTDTIADWTQADLDAQIALGNFPPGTLLADIVLPSDWNDDHTFTGTLPVANGGTGQTSYTDGQLLIGNTSTGGLDKANLTAGAGIGITNNAGSILITNTGGGGGGVSGVTASAPLASSGGSTPNISITQASTSTNGFLSSTDWNTFNGKGNGTVTSITAGTGLSGGTITSSGTIAIDSTVVTLTGSQTLTNKTLTSPVINEILDTNGNEILSFNPVASATDFVSIKNGIGVGAPLHISAAGSSSNVGLHIEPKGTGLVTINDGTDATKGIRFRSSGSATGAITLLDAVSTSGHVVTLPNANTTLVGRDTTDTLTNKSISGSTNTLSNIGNSSLTNSAITINGTSTSLGGSINVGTVTSVTGTAPVVSSGGATPAISMPAATSSVNGYLTSTDWTTFNNKGSGTVTSVGLSAPSIFTVTNSPVTSLGTLTLSYSGTALPIANGGTGTSTAFTTGSVVFAGASGVYSQNNAQFFWDNTNSRLGIGTTSPTVKLDVIGSIEASAAATQDGVILAGRAGGTSSFAVTLTPTTLTTSRTITLPDATTTMVGTDTTQTLTNKRVTPRVSTTTSSATPTINTDTTDQFGLTAQAANITSFTTNLSGTPTDGQKLWIYIVGTAARTITWGASFEASTVPLPTTTVTTNRLDVGFVWNAATSKWRCVAVA